MKKKIGNLMCMAAVMIAMAASVLTSCSNDDINEIAKPTDVVPTETETHVETITIAFPEQAKTRVAIDGEHNLTGWEEGDEVTLVKTRYEEMYEGWAANYDFILEGTYTFTCTDAANGTFSGELPNDVSVKDCQLAFYNATGFEVNRDGKQLLFRPKNRASQAMKDVVVMTAANDGNGHFAMEIFGSILAVTNEKNVDVTASVKFKMYGDTKYYDCAENVYIRNSGYYGFETNVGSEKHSFTLSNNALTYVYIPVYNTTDGDQDFAVGVSAEGDAEDECSIVPFKTNPGNAKLFKKTLMPVIAGTAKRTGNIDVNWVQLWKDGPKFAEYNVGAENNKAEDFGGYYQWGGHYNKDSNEIGYNRYRERLTGTYDTATNIWGSNWRMPIRDEFDDLFVNCDVEWTTVNGVAGRKFTGKGNYNTSSMFLPAAGYWLLGKDYSTQNSTGCYWTSDFAYLPTQSLGLQFSSDAKTIEGYFREWCCSVRPVLAE